MPTYVTLAKWTDQGIRNVKDSPKRAEAFEAAVKAAGGTVRGLYFVMGEYDIVAVTEGPNDETAMKLALGTGMLGSVRTMTMRAFPREEFAKLVAGM